MANFDWSEYPLVEIIPGKVSGVPLLKNTRLPVDAITANYDAFRDDGLTPDAAITETLDCYPEARHEIHNVVSMEWGGIKNGALLTLIGRERFEVFLTGDKNMPSQQQLEGRSFAVLIMSAINWPVVRPHVHQISVTLDEARPGTVSTIDCGAFVAQPKRTSSENE